MIWLQILYNDDKILLDQQVNLQQMAPRNKIVSSMGENVLLPTYEQTSKAKIYDLWYEYFNTLKNQGYHIAHNYGHGDKSLSDNMYLLILLAFYSHQIFELTDGVYQACRVSFGSK